MEDDEISRYLSCLTIDNLRRILRYYKLPVSGIKQDLINRIKTIYISIEDLIQITSYSSSTESIKTTCVVYHTVHTPKYKYISDYENEYNAHDTHNAHDENQISKNQISKYQMSKYKNNIYTPQYMRNVRHSDIVLYRKTKRFEIFCKYRN